MRGIKIDGQRLQDDLYKIRSKEYPTLPIKRFIKDKVGIGYSTFRTLHTNNKVSYMNYSKLGLFISMDKYVV